MTNDRSRVSIRSLRDVEQLRPCELVQRETWGFEPLDVVPCRFMAVIVRNGGLALGAFAGREIVGFVFGYPGIRDDRMVHCSHMLGVRPGHEGRGIGLRLKRAQRDAMLRRGCDRIVWTFDPLETRNAHLNLRRLGARAVEYWPNLYGATSSVLHAGVATDRLLVRWDLAAGGSNGEPMAIDEVPRLNRVQYRGGLPVSSAPRLDARARRLVLEVPSDLRGLRRDHSRSAKRWQARLRDVFVAYFRRGYEVVDYERALDGDERRGAYVLERGRTR